MSYTEYLNRKKASAPVILDTRRKVDASTWTRQERLKAAGATYTPTKSVVGNIRDMVPDYRRDNKAVSPALFVTSNLGTGGAVPNASARTDYVGGQALMGELRSPPPTQKLVLNNALSATMPPEMTVVSGCNWDSTARPNRTYPRGSFETELQYRTNPELVVAKNGSDYIRSNPRFPENGCDEPHEASTLHRGFTQFVDDTISLTGVYGIGIGGGNKRQADGTYRTYTTAVGNNRVGDFLPNNGSTIQTSMGTPVTHDMSATVVNRRWGPGARPSKGAGGLVVPSISSEDHKYKVGGLVPSKHLKYIEKHHGNDMNVNPRRVPTDFIPPANAPRHLKINDPTNVIVK